MYVNQSKKELKKDARKHRGEDKFVQAKLESRFLKFLQSTRSDHFRVYK